MKYRLLWKWLCYGLWAYAALALQLGLLPYLRVGGVQPNLAPLLLGIIVTFETGPSSAVFAFLLGTWCDAFYPPVEMFYTLLFTLAALLAARAIQYLFRKSFVTALLWTAAFCMITNLFLFLLFYYVPARAGVDSLWLVALPETLVSLPFLPILYFPARAVSRRFAPEEESA